MKIRMDRYRSSSLTCLGLKKPMLCFSVSTHGTQW